MSGTPRFPRATGCEDDWVRHTRSRTGGKEPWKGLMGGESARTQLKRISPSNKRAFRSPLLDLLGQFLHSASL